MRPGERSTWLVSIAGVAIAVSGCGTDPGSTGTTRSDVSTDAPQPTGTTSTAQTVVVAPTPPENTVTIAPADELIPAGLPAFDEPVPSYVWSGDRRPTREDFEALAEALGITGDVSEGAFGAAGGWVLDGDNLRLELDGGIEGAWSYSGPPPFSWPSEDEPWPTIETGEPVTVAPAIPAPSASPPDNYPTPDEAQALAEGIVDSLRLDPAAFEWRSSWRGTSSEVEAWWVIDGVVSPMKLSFGFGPDDVLLFASGQLVPPAAGPAVARIGTAAAGDRLRAEIERVRSRPLGGTILVGGVVAPGEPDAAITLDDPSTPVPAPEPPVVHPTAVPPSTMAPELVGRIIEVEASWQVVRDEAGTRLLPAYTFIEGSGMRYTVPAAA